MINSGPQINKELHLLETCANHYEYGDTLARKFGALYIIDAPDMRTRNFRTLGISKVKKGQNYDHTWSQNTIIDQSKSSMPK
jgi:hypothetical protein